jgi:Secretion system C-terminal sorting domain/FG-GAP-like repeat
MRKNHLFLCCYLSLISIAHAQFDFTQNIVIDETYGRPNPRKVLVADIDSDGFKDVISLANDVVWYKNLDGLGNFGKVNLVDEFDFSGSWFDNIDVGDMDGDGDEDLVYFRGVNNSPLVWVENLDGLGNFGSAQTIKAITTTSSTFVLNVKLLDMDGDNDLDISYSDIDGISWFENTDGQGNFEDHLILNLNYNPSFPDRDYQITDVDGDGLKDMIVDFDSEIKYYKQNENGAYIYTQTLDTSALVTYMHIGDIDNDGDDDVINVLIDGVNSKIEWFQNNRDEGNFNAKVTLADLPSMATTNNNPRNDISIVDLDQDGLLDILFSDVRTDTVSWFKNLGMAVFGSEQIITTTAQYVNSIYAADIDNDNTMDVVVSALNDSQVSWFSNTDGFGDFGDEILVSSYVYILTSFTKGDLDRDGDLDLVSVSKVDGKIAWYKNTDGLGDFSEKQIIIKNSLEIPDDVFITDIENDGDLDIIVKGFMDIYATESRIYQYINDGSTNFTEQLMMTHFGELGSSVVGDIDADYDADIVGVKDAINLYRIKNNGDGTFEDDEIIVSNLTSSIIDLKFEDIDNDGDNDLIVSHINGDFSWYSNSDGLGTFVLGQIIEGAAVSPESIYIQDINKDGYKDILFIDNDSSEIAYMLSLGGLGAFSDKVVAVSSGSALSSIYMLDMDNDRDLDIVSSKSVNTDSNQIVWFENFGDLNFGPAIEIANGVGGLNHVDAADLDDNGSLDLITASGDNQLMWLRNLGLPRNEIQGSVTLDYDNDGCDNEDSPFANAMIVAESGTNQYGTFTGFNGLYQMLIEEPGDYTTSFSTNLPEYFNMNPESYSSDLNDLGISESLDFCISQLGEFHDLEISIFPITQDPRPGFQSQYRVVYTNRGAVRESGTITFEYDGSMMTYDNATETVQSLTVEEVVFNFQDLDPLESRFIDIVFTILPPPTVNAGDLLNFFSTVDGGNDSDLTPVNNTHGIKQFVVNSYDPNDISVMEGPEIFIEDADKYLHYLIRFQNTGSASAININVEHELDEKLDWETMRLENLSHPGRVEIINGSMVNFIFDDIHLPDSTSNEPASHGHIAYKIKPKSNVVVGDVFSAVADIYFDFNAPIITNTATTEIVEPLGVAEFDMQSIQLFPNPAKDKLEIVSNQVMDKFTIIDLNGRLLKEIKLSNLEYSLDVSSLTKGVYFLEIKSRELKSTKKFIKN